MANSKKIKINGFNFKPFSKKQLRILTCWQNNSPVKDKFIIIADGAIRSGKTIAMALSFVLFVMNNFNQQYAAMCGKSVGSFRRNVLGPLKQMLITVGYEVIEHRSDNYVEIINGNTVNYFYIFGGKDESSQDLIQGITLCALLLDEVALMPESFFNQAMGRLSIEGSKAFLNCNPSSPHHWFYTKILMNLRKKNGLYIHFKMTDNKSLSPATLLQYKTTFSGVWAERYIEGKWSVADGLIYDMFDKNINTIDACDIPYGQADKWAVGVDYGTGNATCFLLGFRAYDGKIYICKEYYFAGRKEAEEANNYDAQKTDLEFAEDMKIFLGTNKSLTGLGYDDIEILVDPAANSFKLQLRRMRMKSKNANNDVLDGIRNVASLYKQGKLIISKECPNLIKQTYTYSWDPKTQEKGIDAPKKIDDHAKDAERYLCQKLKSKSSIKNATRNIGL